MYVGEEFELRVTVTDACGNKSDMCVAQPEICPPDPLFCGCAAEVIEAIEPTRVLETPRPRDRQGDAQRPAGILDRQRSEATRSTRGSRWGPRRRND